MSLISNVPIILQGSIGVVLSRLNLILGGAGFIGSNLANRLHSQGDRVLVVDNFFRKNQDKNSTLNREIPCIELDLGAVQFAISSLQKSLLSESGIKVWHLAANSDIRAGQADITVDLWNTLNTTITALGLISKLNVSEFVFASSSAIYGKYSGIPFSETNTNFMPESNYGYMKLLSEFAISTQSSLDDDTLIRIYRFPNVVGQNMTHGVIFDFYQKLQSSGQVLEVLGNGLQKKPFIHVDDLINAMIHLNQVSGRIEVFNIAPQDDGIEIREIAQLMIQKLRPNLVPKFGHTSGGWEGDIPVYKFNTQKSLSKGLSLDQSSRDAVLRAIASLQMDAGI